MHLEHIKYSHINVEASVKLQWFHVKLHPHKNALTVQ